MNTLKNPRLSIEKCRKILNANGHNYSDAEIIKIRNWIYYVTEITFEFIKSRTPEELNEIKKFLTENVKITN